MAAASTTTDIIFYVLCVLVGALFAYLIWYHLALKRYLKREREQTLLDMKKHQEDHERFLRLLDEGPPKGPKPERHLKIVK